MKEKVVTRALLLASILTTFLILRPALVQALDEIKEPPLAYYIHAGDDIYETKLGERVVIKGKDPAITLRAAETRFFNYGGVSFKYPAFFTWEADIEGSDYKCWTLSGNDFKIMHFNSNNELDDASYEQKMLAKFTGKQLGPIERKMGESVLKGRKFSMVVGGHTMTNEVYVIKTAGFSAMLVFQDSPQENGKPSLEGIKTLDLLGETFKKAA